MSRALLRSVLELRAPITRLPPTFLLPIRARYIHQTTPIIESAQPGSSIIPEALKAQPQTSQADISSSIVSATSALPQSATPAAPASTTASATDLDPSVRELLPLLAAQPGHYVTIHVHGRPYLVTAGDQVRLPFKMPGVVPGDVLRLNRASVLGSRDFTLKGEPYVDERLFECRAVVLGAEAEPMRIMIKKKRRCRRKKQVKSKHKYTILRVSELRINELDEMEC